MASSRGTLHSLSLCKIIYCSTVVLLFSTFKLDRNFCNNGSLLLIACKLNYIQYPSCNLMLRHQQHHGPNLPSPLKAFTGLHMLNTSFCASLILLSRDINLSPVKDRCFLCNKGFRSNQKAVQCDSCDNWYHVKCVGMKNCEYFDLYLTPLGIGFAQSAFAFCLCSCLIWRKILMEVVLPLTNQLPQGCMDQQISLLNYAVTIYSHHKRLYKIITSQVSGIIIT